MATGLSLSGRPLFPHLFGDDFLPSYMAGTFVRQGRVDLLMDYPAAERFQADLRRAEGLEQHGRTGPWLNPPFYALPFAALSALPYRAALWTWFGLNLAMLGGSVVLLYRMLPKESRRPGDAAAIAILLVCSMPGLQAMACQQNTFLSLLLLAGAVSLGRGGRPAWAGVAAGLLAFKPQLAVIVWLTLAATLGWRAVAGVAASAGVLGAVTLLAMPGAIEAYLTRLPAALPHLRMTLPYPWERQVTIQGFFRLLLQGRTAGPALPLVALLGGLGMVTVGATVLGMLGRAWMGRRSAVGLSAGACDRATAAAVAAMPLLMPYYMDYDLLLLAVPALLMAAGRCQDVASQRAAVWVGRRPDWRFRGLVAVWAGLFAWLFVNAAVADATGVSLTVVLLATVAGATVWGAASALRSGAVRRPTPIPGRLDAVAILPVVKAA